MDHGVEGNTVLHRSIASGTNKGYSNTDFSHVKNFFRNIVLKTTWLYDVRLQDYDVINFVPFLDHPVDGNVTWSISLSVDHQSLCSWRVPYPGVTRRYAVAGKLHCGVQRSCEQCRCCPTADSTADA